MGFLDGLMVTKSLDECWLFWCHCSTWAPNLLVYDDVPLKIVNSRIRHFETNLMFGKHLLTDAILCHAEFSIVGSDDTWPPEGIT